MSHICISNTLGYIQTNIAISWRFWYMASGQIDRYREPCSLHWISHITNILRIYLALTRNECNPWFAAGAHYLSEDLGKKNLTNGRKRRSSKHERCNLLKQSMTKVLQLRKGIWCPSLVSIGDSCNASSFWRMSNSNSASSSSYNIFNYSNFMSVVRDPTSITSNSGLP